jgi:hypothetical protein
MVLDKLAKLDILRIDLITQLTHQCFELIFKLMLLLDEVSEVSIKNLVPKELVPADTVLLPDC